MSEPNFSQREGIIPLSKKPQINGIDEELANGLWNVISKHYLPNIDDYFEYHPSQSKLYYSLYHDFYKSSVDDIPKYVSSARDKVKESFFEGPWNRVYDLIEFLIKYENINEFTKECNDILSREFSGYVLVSGKIVHRISNHEIAQIEKALNNPVEAARKHLDKALGHVSNRENPDYANSIKESISAVEAVCQKICGNSKATLSEALRTIKKKGIITISPALHNGLDSLYGYTSSSQGIRHAGGNEPEVPQEDAMMMLTICSGIVNYLVVKAEKSKIPLI